MANIMKLNIQRFTGEGKDLDFKDDQALNVVNGLSQYVPELAEAIRALSRAIDQLTQDWGDGNAVNYGNQFRSDYISLVQDVNAYIQSVGGFAQTACNALSTQYGIEASYTYSGEDLPTDVEEFTEYNSSGSRGPANDQIGTAFKRTFEDGVNQVRDALNSIYRTFTDNPEAFVDDVQKTVDETVNAQNTKVENSVDECGRSEAENVQKYVDAAVELANQTQQAAQGTAQ